MNTREQDGSESPTREALADDQTFWMVSGAVEAFEHGDDDERAEALEELNAWLSRHTGPGRILLQDSAENATGASSGCAPVDAPSPDPVEPSVAAAEQGVPTPEPSDAGLRAIVDTVANMDLHTRTVGGAPSDTVFCTWVDRLREALGVPPEMTVTYERCSALSAPPSDTLLDSVEENAWDLRSHHVPTGFDDFNITWSVVEHFMADPKERVVGEGTTAREAIRAALAEVPQDSAWQPAPDTLRERVEAERDRLWALREKRISETAPLAEVNRLAFAVDTLRDLLAGGAR